MGCECNKKSSSLMSNNVLGSVKRLPKKTIIKRLWKQAKNSKNV